MSTPSPKYIARAIGNALEANARRAQDYLAEWQTLVTAGVPAEHARAVLDQKRQETTSTVQVSKWDGRGWLGLCGDYGPGKTFAAACWLLDQSRRGRTVCWVNAVRWAQLDLRDQEALVRRATSAQCLVFDDIGAGVTRRKAAGKQDWFAQQLEGVLMDRGSKPTITASNMDTDEVIDWLGQRLLDRLRQCGELVQISGPSLRESRPDKHDDKGRSPRWHRANKLVGQLGIRWASVWTDGRDVAHVVVGEKLEQNADVRYRASTKDGPDAEEYALAEAHDLARRYKLELDEIMATAAVLEANDPAKLLAVKVDESLGKETPMAKAKRRAADNIADDNARRSRECYETLDEMTSRARGESNPSTKPSAREPAPWTRGPDGIGAMRRLGYRVTPRETSGGFEVRKTAGLGKGAMVLPAHATEPIAWDALRLLLSSGWDSAT